MPSQVGATEPWEAERVPSMPLWRNCGLIGQGWSVSLRDFSFLRAQSPAGTLPWLGSAELLEGRAWQEVLVPPGLCFLTASTSGRQ